MNNDTNTLTSYPTGVRLVAGPVENFNKPKKG